MHNKIREKGSDETDAGKNDRRVYRVSQVIVSIAVHAITEQVNQNVDRTYGPPGELGWNSRGARYWKSAEGQGPSACGPST